VMYGEAGLRRRLALEISRFGADGRARAEAALELAARLHAGDRRQREPSINHLLRVAIRILSHYQVSDVDVVCAALLHDTVEDHSDDLAPGCTRQDAVAILAGQFGERTGQLVAAVTNPVWEPGRSPHEQYRDHVTVSLEASPWARAIKLSDFTDNSVGLIHTSGPKLATLARKYRPIVSIMREFALRADTPLDDEVKTLIVAQIDSATVRLAATAGQHNAVSETETD
jgi:(p)ppGpp synthase/HD superfamily hydrolase